MFFRKAKSSKGQNTANSKASGKWEPSEDKILQIIPAPAHLEYFYEGDDKARHVTCLALVELSNGDREVRAMGITNSEIIEDLGGSGALLID